MMTPRAQPPAIPGFSAQGGFYFQFNDLSNGAYTFHHRKLREAQWFGT